MVFSAAVASEVFAFRARSTASFSAARSPVKRGASVSGLSSFLWRLSATRPFLPLSFFSAAFGGSALRSCFAALAASVLFSCETCLVRASTSLDVPAISSAVHGLTRRAVRQFLDEGTYQAMLDGAFPYAEMNALFGDRP